MHIFYLWYDHLNVRGIVVVIPNTCIIYLITISWIHTWRLWCCQVYNMSGEYVGFFDGCSLFSCARKICGDWNKLMISNMLKRRKESDTYLATVRRHSWSRQIMMKIDKIGDFSQHCGFCQQRRKTRPLSPFYIVLYWWKWSLLPDALRPFWDLLCSPEFRYYWT